MTGPQEPRDDHSGEQSTPDFGAVWRAIGPRKAAMIVGGIIVLVLVLSQLGGGDGSDDLALDTTTTQSDGEQDSDPLGLFGRSEDRPAVNPIRGCDLLTDEVLLAALGSEQRGLEDMGNSKRGRGETCTAWLGAEDEYRVSIEPGEPSDFAPGATLDGHVGDPVDEVGDSAVWFPGSDGEGHTSQLAVHQATPIGDLVFRVAIGRPDVAPEAQLPYASAAARELLPMFPFVASEPPEPEQLVFETEEPPEVGETLVDRVLAGQASGRWSLGEGLVEGLRYLFDESSSFESQPGVDLFEGSAAGLIRMAIAYADHGDDAAARTEIEELLAIPAPLVWTQPPPEDTPGDGGADTEATGPGPSGGLTAARATGADVTPVVNPVAPVASITMPAVGAAAQESQDTSDCLFQDRTVHGADSPTCKPTCLWLHRTGLTDPYCLEEIGGIELYYPEAIIEPILEGSGYGWDRGDLEAIREGVVAAADFYGLYGQVDNIKVELSSRTEDVGLVLPSVVIRDECWVSLTTPLQNLPPEHQTFSVAIDIAGCLVHYQLPENVFDEAGAFRWWYAGLTTYLAAEALPESNVEWLLMDDLQDSELRSSLQTRKRASNWAFFASVALEAGGPLGAFDVVGPLSDAPTIQAQQEKLAGVSGVDERLQDFHEQLSDGVAGDGFYDPPSRPVSLGPYMRLQQQITRFGAARYHVTVPSGRYACFENRSGNVKISWRSGAPVSATTGFEDGVPVDLTDEAVIVVTSVHEGQSFDALVRLFREPGCGDDEDDAGDVDMPEPCGFCDPSLFYRNPGSVDDAKSGPPEGDDEPDSDGGDADDGDGSGGGGDGGDTAGGDGAPPASQDPDEVERWLESLCPIWDEWLDGIEVTDGVDPATLDLDDRLDRATRITEAFVDASDELLRGFDDVDAPEVYRAYQQAIADEVEFVRDDMQRYLDEGFRTLTDLADAGLERQVGMSLINSEPRDALDELSTGDRRLFDTVADGIPVCLFLPR